MHIGGMIKFWISPNFGRGRGANLRKCWKNVKIIGFSIFWDILDKIKVNLCQECVKGGFYAFKAKLEQLSLISTGK